MSNLYGLKEVGFLLMLLLLLSCFDGDNLLTIIGDVVVVFKSFFSASVLPILLHVAARRASGDALLSVACKHKKKNMKK